VENIVVINTEMKKLRKVYDFVILIEDVTQSVKKVSQNVIFVEVNHICEKKKHIILA